MPTSPSTASEWRNWAGTARARPVRTLAPGSAAEVAAAVLTARSDGRGVKMVGSGHSFTPLAVTDGLMLLPDRLSGVTAVDRDAMTVTVLAGTPLHVLNARLESLGLALHNLGDIDRQTVAGAVATGTHGSGGRRASLSAQVAALQVVLADGSVREASREQDGGLFEAARLGLGAVGVLTAVTIEVEPAFRLDSTERVVSFAELLAGLAPGGLDTVHDHVDVHWFPYTDRALVKTHDRTLDEARPLSRLRRHVDDELLANRVFGVLAGAGSRSPTRAVRTNRLIARALSGRHYVDASHRVLVSPRRVRFREMEYAVPRPTAREVLVEVRRLLERNRWPVTFPVEIRTAPADDVWLSAAHARATAYLAFHVAAEVDHRPFFTAVEAVLRDHGGRPHWGKLHTRTAADLAPDYPRWPDFAAIRDRVDPERIFTNPYLERVLGP